MDDNGKRIGSAIVTTILLIIWVALRAERCNRRNSYDYTYTPSYPIYTPPSNYGNDYQSSLDKTQKALDEMLEQDATYQSSIMNIDPIAIAADPKNTQCQALDDVVEGSATWKVGVGELVLADDAVETTAMSAFPVYVFGEDEVWPKGSPELVAQGQIVVEKIIDGSYISTPRLKTRDLLMQVGVMPKPEKGQKRPKNAPAPGKLIVRGWIYDHVAKRVLCAGFVPVAKPNKGDNAKRLTEAQLAKLIDDMPSALKNAPINVEAPQ